MFGVVFMNIIILIFGVGIMRRFVISGLSFFKVCLVVWVRVFLLRCCFFWIMGIMLLLVRIVL